MKIITVLFFTIVCTLQLQAQHKYNWSKYDSLPFKDDSVQSFINTEVQNNIIYPIKESKSNIEIRFYIPGDLAIHGSIFTIQYFKDTVIANEYSYFYREWSPFMTGYEFIGKRKDAMRTDICRRVTASPIKIDFVTELNTAIDNKLLTLPDNKEFADSVTQNKIILNKPAYNCVNCGGYILCEIKVGNKYRNFRIWNRATEYYNINNAVMVLKNNSCLLNFLKKAYK